MSSYELLELVEHLPDDGAFKAAARGGRWTLEQATLAEVFNEIARLRASVHAVAGGRSAAYEPARITDPAALVEQVETEAVHTAAVDATESFLARRILKQHGLSR